MVFSRSGVDASDLLDKERFRWRFFCTSSTPRALEEFKSKDADDAVKVENGNTPIRARLCPLPSVHPRGSPVVWPLGSPIGE